MDKTIKMLSYVSIIQSGIIIFQIFQYTRLLRILSEFSLILAQFSTILAQFGKLV